MGQACLCQCVQFTVGHGHDRLVELGDMPFTPYREAIFATAAIYGRLASEGRFIPSEHGVPTAQVNART